MIENYYELIVQKDKVIIVDKKGQLTQTDEFQGLVTKIEDISGTYAGVLARVNMGVSESLEFGAVKVSASVTLTCDQNEKKINKAGELAFKKSLELVMDGFREYGVKAGPQ